MEGAVIDWNRVRSLNEEVGPEAFPEVVAMFFDEVDEVLARLRSMTGLTPAQVAADLHMVRGSALNLGFLSLGKLCESAESEARAGRIAPRDPILRCYALSREAFLAGTAGAMP